MDNIEKTVQDFEEKLKLLVEQAIYEPASPEQLEKFKAKAADLIKQELATYSLSNSNVSSTGTLWRNMKFKAKLLWFIHNKLFPWLGDLKREIYDLKLYIYQLKEMHPEENVSYDFTKPYEEPVLADYLHLDPWNEILIDIYIIPNEPCESIQCNFKIGSEGAVIDE